MSTMPVVRFSSMCNRNAVPTVLRLPPAIHDNRFQVAGGDSYFLCDNMRCRRIARFNSPEMPFDGQYEEYDGSLPCASLHALWEEGYNFMWYCTKCHAEHFGLTSKEADLEHTRMLLGLRVLRLMTIWTLTQHLLVWRLLMTCLPARLLWILPQCQ